MGAFGFSFSFASGLDDLWDEFKDGNFSAFVEALRLCIENQEPLPEWVAAQAMDNAAFALARQPKGRGRKSNWTATANAAWIRNRRADLVYRYLVYPRPKNVVTQKDVFEFVARELRGTREQGSARQIARAYRDAVKSGRYLRQ